MSEKALEGTKVLEYASFISGPYCSKLLADLGAEVIKIERTGVGDEARRRGPFLGDIPHPERSGLFLYLNTNKKGITLDPETQTGRKIFLELVRWADILIEDKPPKEMEELGFTYDKLKEINPQLIMTSITPFGQTGPYRDYKAYPLNVVHGAGSGYLAPGGSQNLEREPVKSTSFSDDAACGISAAFATICALLPRWSTGVGQYIDVSKQEALMAMDQVELCQYPNEGKVASRKVDPRMAIRVTPCKDGDMMIIAMDDRQWKGLVSMMDEPEWTKDEIFKDILSRMQHMGEMLKNVAPWAMQHTRDEMYHTGQERGAPVAPIRSIEEAANWQQFKERDFFVEIDHPKAGRISYPSAPYKLSKTPWEGGAAPLLGQHNEEVYSTLLGYSKEDIVMMREAGVI